MVRTQDKLLVSSIIAIIVLILIGVFGFNNQKLVYDETINSGLFEYEQSITSESIEEKYFYSDSYFKDEGSVENEHLRTFALALALAFNPTKRKETVNYNINKLLEELKFNNIEYYDLEEFSKDTIGIAIANKELNKKYNLVVISLRGASYADEWESNFDLGESGNAKGFDEASNLVLERLKEYLKENKINNYKLLVTGYSRAGAVSNLVGVHINEDPKDYSISKDDLYVYTFEAPNGVGKDKDYDNIHNIVNHNDLVTYFYPEFWGLYRSGIETDITTERTKIKEKYLSILSSEKIKDLEEVDKQDFIKDTVNLLSKDRSSYAKASNSLGNVYRMIKTNSSNRRLIEFIKKHSEGMGLSEILSIMGIINLSESDARVAYDSFMTRYDKYFDEIKNEITKEEYDGFKEDVFKVVMFFQPTIKSDYNNNYMFYHILTIVYNLDELFVEHYFSTNFEQVKKLDSYYK